MQTLVVYESMYGSTRAIAEAIATGTKSAGPVSVLPACEVNPEALDGVGLLVVGAPTHAWSLPRPRTRRAAVSAPSPGSPRAEVNATEPGVRELLSDLPELECPAAAFDTRFKAPALVTGRSSRSIARRLRHRGATLVTGPRSFLVDRSNHLLPGQAELAAAWGTELVADRQHLIGRHH